MLTSLLLQYFLLEGNLKVSLYAYMKKTLIELCNFQLSHFL